MGWAQHCRVLGELEPTVRLHVAYGDISVVRLGDAVAERLERLDGLLDPLLEHGTRIDPRPEVPAPKARRGAQHVMDFGDGLDVGVDVERRHGVLVAEDRLERPGPRVDGSIVLDEVQGTGAREVRSMIFYAPGEGTLLYPGLRAEDHLKMVCDMWPHARDIEEIVEQTQIGEFAKMRIRTLSQGMKQQLTLAIAYATGARYLLLDEPMNALDPSRVDLHSEILRKLADSGTCIIMSSHILDSVDRLCDEILFLKDGRLIRSIPQDDAAPKSPGSHFAKPAGRAEGALSTYRRLYEKGG